jgi:outer membrane PBP1 activator LpoA protein
MKKYLFIFLVFLLTSCQSLFQTNYIDTQNPHILELLHKAESTENLPAKNEFLFQAFNQAFLSKEKENVIKIANQINYDYLNIGKAQNVIIRKSEILLGEGRSKEALENFQANAKYLQNISSDSVANQIKYSNTYASALLLNGYNLQAIQERVFIYPLLDSIQQQNDLPELIRLSKTLPANTNLVGDKNVDGFIELGALLNNANSLDKQYQEWLQKYPNHMAMAWLFAQKPTLKQNFLKHITVVLPQNTNVIEASNAILYGFNKYIKDSVKNNISMPEISLLAEENFNNTQEMYSFLIGKTDLIVGPLSKNLVTAITLQENLPVDTLVLNNSGRRSNLKRLMQYSLNPRDESNAVARQLNKENLQTVAVLVRNFKNGDWSWNVFQGLQDNYRGQIVKLNYDEVNQVPALIKSVADSNIQSIFVIGEPDITIVARAETFRHNLQNLPFFTMSHTNNGNLAPEELAALSGVRFFESPTIVNLSNNSNNAQMIKMSAFGSDAAKLAMNFHGLNSGQKFQGLTGELIIQDDSVHRVLQQHIFTNVGVIGIK